MKMGVYIIYCFMKLTSFIICIAELECITHFFTSFIAVNVEKISYLKTLCKGPLRISLYDVTWAARFPYCMNLISKVILIILTYWGPSLLANRFPGRTIVFLTRSPTRKGAKLGCPGRHSR